MRTLSGLRFPHERVLLARTKLAYVHLRNLLTDAKRDRAARVFGYVAIYLPDCLLVLYMQEGEVVTATASTDGQRWDPIAIADAVAKVPTEPELGEIAFHEADDEQLACMYQAQCEPALEWPPELDPRDARALFPYLRSSMFDGVVEVVKDHQANYLVFRDGSVVRTFLRDEGVGTVPSRVLKLFEPSRSGGAVRVTQRGVPSPLPAQAPAALVDAYRDLVTRLVVRLRDGGSDGAWEIAESARVVLSDKHPVLAQFAVGRAARCPVVAPDVLTAAIAAWVAELLFATGDASPEDVLAELTRERRHMLQSAGFFDLLPWMVTW